MRILTAILFASLIAPASLAQTAEPPPPQTAESAPPLHFEGFIDAYYAWNANSPDRHENFVPGTGTSAKRSNEAALNLVALEISRDAAPAGFKLFLVAGNGTDIVHAGEPQGTATGPETYRHVYQASVSCKLNDRLMLEGGLYPSHIGFESFLSKDNWNYTRSWLGELSPYYQTGIKAAYALNRNWSGQVHLLNGWQIIGENNDGKSVGTQIAYSKDRLTASLNTFLGPELANDNHSLRMFGNVVIVYKATPQVSLGASVDVGRQERPGSGDANWKGIAAYGRYAMSERAAFAVRAEQFDDPDNGISGTAQTLREVTLTYEIRPAHNLIVKIEGRHDRSTAAVFKKHADAFSASQTLVIVGAVATF
ncbi:MAG: porin [Acidobacteriota bacterium]